MLFNSYTFAIFFAFTLAAYALPLSWKVRKFNLLWLSYIFYAAWNPPFVVLLWFSTVLDWFCGKWAYSTDSKLKKKLALILSLVGNLGMLGFFKYGGFLLENFTALLNALGLDFHPASPSIILPVGISFYTFQTLSYTIDIYRGRLAPTKSFLDYALFVTFFPQLVAGPIVRAADFLPQCEEPKRTSSEGLGWGMSLMVFGLFLKMAVADGIMAPMVEAAYDHEGGISSHAAWIGTLAFSMQIFCDFAGYSYCAIGAALCMGFRLPVNFRAPYAAIGFSDFWRRWHLSLSTWLRDYLYIPLGGNRKGTVRTYFNLMATMLLGGLWHGASWNFVIWGGLHGIYLAVERAVRDATGWRLPGGRVARFVLALGTFFLVSLTWVFFRAKTLSGAVGTLAAMFGFGGEVMGERDLARSDVAAVLFAGAAIVAAHWYLREVPIAEAAARAPWWLRAAALAAMMLAICVIPGEDRAFIYFQF